MDFKILKAYILEFDFISTGDKRFFFAIGTVNGITVKIDMYIIKTNWFQLVFPMDRIFVLSQNDI